ncbi:MAG: GspH/FimT family pseudopilin [Pseudomonadota bacterium]
MKNQRGLTLLELLIAIAIGVILVGVGVPNFLATIRNSQMTSATNGLVGALYTARSEAVKRRARVTLCRAAAVGDNPVCNRDGDRLLVFENVNNDLSFDGADTLVRFAPWLTETQQPVYDAVPEAFSFNASGFTRDQAGNVVNGTVVMCDDRGNDLARAILISPTGRANIRPRNDVGGAPNCPTL